MQLIATITAAAGFLGMAQAACSVVSSSTITFYGYPDNDPPSDATAYNCGGRNFHARTGSGTYSDPITMASAQGEFNSCEIVYVPYLKKYVRYEDYCEQCTQDWKSGKHHIDIWTGTSSNGGQNQINCENNLTPNAQSYIRNPAQNYEVDQTPLFSGGKCATSHTYNNNAASNYCK